MLLAGPDSEVEGATHQSQRKVLCFAQSQLNLVFLVMYISPIHVHCKSTFNLTISQIWFLPSVCFHHFLSRSDLAILANRHPQQSILQSHPQFNIMLRRSPLPCIHTVGFLSSILFIDSFQALSINQSSITPKCYLSNTGWFQCDTYSFYLHKESIDGKSEEHYWRRNNATGSLDLHEGNSCYNFQANILEALH